MNTLFQVAFNRDFFLECDHTMQPALVLSLNSKKSVENQDFCHPQTQFFLAKRDAHVSLAPEKAYF